MPVNADQLEKAIIAAGLLPADELRSVWARLPAGERPADGESYAAVLVQQGKLTPFQAQELLSETPTPLVLGDYVLLSQIGAGGMGQVFQARHRHMERLVAIKLLPPTLTRDATAVQRFQREVKAAARLSHPQIVQAHDASVQRGIWYLVMEYVEGRDLSSVVANEGPLPVARAIDYVRQAARGLAYAHGEGVVHRDIKPANLLIDKRGTVKILDMGLARFDDTAAAAQDGLTQSGQVMGTVDYMAPEQAFDTHQADARADIYSLGCTLYRLLTGQNLYEGQSLVQKLMQHQSAPIPQLPQSLGSGELSEDSSLEALNRVLQKMVAKRPEDRFATMAEVETALAQLAGDFPAAAALVTGSLAGATRAQAALTSDGNSPTIALVNPLHATDPISERSIQTAREHTPPPVMQGRPLTWWRNPLVITVGGVAGLLLLALGIWAVTRGNGDAEIAQIPVPAGGAAVIETVEDLPANRVPLPTQAPFTAAEAKRHQQAWADHLGRQIATPNGAGQTMILIPPGEFSMGSTVEQVAAAVQFATEQNFDSGVITRMQVAERPQHRVAITRPFLLSATEVTIGQFKKFSASGYVTAAEQAAEADAQVATFRDPGYAVTDDFPATALTWHDALAYCGWLSEQEQTVYRLPTEAEWEYACRAGSETQYSFGDDQRDLGEYGWHEKGEGKQLHPVRKLGANPFGLYDVHGNAWEWCRDGWDEKEYEKAPQDRPRVDPVSAVKGMHRVLRGGAANSNSARCRSAFRYVDAATRHDVFGFRVVAEIK